MNFLFCSIYLTVFTGILAKMMNSPESSTTDAPPPTLSRSAGSPPPLFSGLTIVSQKT